MAITARPVSGIFYHTPNDVGSSPLGATTAQYGWLAGAGGCNSVHGWVVGSHFGLEPPPSFPNWMTEPHTYKAYHSQEHAQLPSNFLLSDTCPAAMRFPFFLV